jgi:hypothetical protein
MPIAMLQMIPGGTQEQYEQLGEKIFGTRSGQFSPSDAPEGLIMHSAGPSDDGWYVYDIWESEDHVRRFMEERVMPAAQDVEGPPPGPPQIFQIYNLVQVPSGTRSE